MGFYKLSVLALLSLRVLGALGAAEVSQWLDSSFLVHC
jgi:hypothetical protein